MVAAIVEWHRLRGGEGDFADYLAFLAAYPGLAGAAVSCASAAKAAIPAAAPAAEVIAYFDGTAPQTGTGALRLALALRRARDHGRPSAVAVRAWRELTPGRGDRERRCWPSSARCWPITTSPGWTRCCGTATGAGRADAARACRRAGGCCMTRGSALRRDTPGVDSLIAAVPDSLAGDAGLAWERSDWRARQRPHRRCRSR